MTYTLIRNTTLIDGNGGSPIPNAAILVKDNHIHNIGLADTISLPNTEMIEVDAKGGFTLPGFIDTHVHFMLEGLDTVTMLTTPFSLNFYQAIDRMRRTVEAGITTVRDAGGTDLGMKQAVEQGLILGPRMQISISILTITGGHLDYWMRSGQDLDLFPPPYPGHPGLGVRCDGVEEVRKKVREILRAGAEVIKVCSTGGVSSPTDHPDFTQFTIEELQVIVQETAYRRGIKVMAHAQGLEGIKNAVQAGVHSIEHGIYLDDKVIEMMLERGTFLVPTFSVVDGIIQHADETGSPEWVIRKAKEVMDAHQKSIRKAYQAGVKIAMGTDSGVMPHGTNLCELRLMCDIGMTPMESIVASTKVAAECLGWQDKIGTIETGKLADIVVCNGDPINNLRVLEDVNNIVLVMKDGQVVKNLLYS